MAFSTGIASGENILSWQFRVFQQNRPDSVSGISSTILAEFLQSASARAGRQVRC
jgi:hypothetical protein